jgi:hypothetical protein
MVTTEIRLRDAILSGILEPKLFLEDVDAIWPSDTTKGIEQDLEV